MRISLGRFGWIIVFCGGASLFAAAPTAQRSIDRVELMPNQPQPFKLKDFKAVAQGYDKLVFNPSASGEFQPLLWWDDTKINFPMRTFGLPSYVGNNQKRGGDDHEAITTIGPVLGATAIGIDKSAGPYNWVEMCEAYFNRKNGQNVLLNNISTETGKTYWYETFPQILFNCLIDRYPNVPRGSELMRTAADRWNEAYRALAARPGGLNFEHTAFNLKTMKPYDNGQWREPDGAAGIAWIQYSAFHQFHDPKYLEAAKALTDYLANRETNPLYEIDLPFGAYVAARLNAEQGTNYDTGRLINWCFNPSDSRSGWGVIVGNWGGYDVSGLAGSVSDGGGYGFVMNTFAMGGALVPIARYDERYARGLGKWMLNAANAVRLCYPDELPAENQSSRFWKSDPADVIAYEGLRKTRDGKSPYASGDPIIGGAGKTDLGLYGGGLVGLFGGIISPTSDPMIPRLDLLATDFFRGKADPSYLLYNPYDDARTVSFAVDHPVDVYDAIRNQVVASNQSGEVKVELAKDTAAVLVLVPAGCTLTYDGRRTLADGVVIDFDNGRVPREAEKTPPARKDQSVAVAADHATITVDGDPSDWKNLKSQPLHLDTGGRGQLKADLRYAWDENYLYVLLEQTSPSTHVHEATDAKQYAAAPWDFDGVWLYLDLANGGLPSIGDVIWSLPLSSDRKPDGSFAPALQGVASAELHEATSGSASKNNRVIEAKIAWAGLRDYAFNRRDDLISRFGPIRAGLRVGCEPNLVEFSHKSQSFIGGAQYSKPTGFDVNSRDILLIDSKARNEPSGKQ